MSLDDYIDTIMMLESVACFLKITFIKDVILYISIKSELLRFIFSLEMFNSFFFSVFIQAWFSYHLAGLPLMSCRTIWPPTVGESLQCPS